MPRKHEWPRLTLKSSSKTRPRRRTIRRPSSPRAPSTSSRRCCCSPWQRSSASTIGAPASRGKRTGRSRATSHSISASSSRSPVFTGSSLLMRTGRAHIFLTQDQLRRVLQVFVPTLLFCLLTQWLGLYVASFLLIAGFMSLSRRYRLGESLLPPYLLSLF